MVRRLGRGADGPGTQFALIRVPGQFDDFFIDEHEFDSDRREVIDYSPGGGDLNSLQQNARDMLKSIGHSRHSQRPLL